MKKMLALLMAVVMVVSVFSVSAFATEGEGAGDDEGTSSVVSSEPEDEDKDDDASSDVTDENGDDTSSATEDGDDTSSKTEEGDDMSSTVEGDDENKDPEDTDIDVDPAFAFPFQMEHVAYVTGRGNNKVAPDADLTRAEAAMMMYRLLNDDVRDKYMGDEPEYSDVALDAWYADAVKCLTGIGMINGYPDGTFQPNDKITRGEFVAMLARVFDEDAEKGEGFTDAIPDWAEDDILRAQAAGIVKGYPDGSFQAAKNVSRAEAMSFINRLFGRDCYDGTDAECAYDDITPAHWAYGAVMEATQEHEADMDEWSEDIL